MRTIAIHRAQPGRGGEQNPRFEALPPLSLYVHLPWCVRKCPYCDFNSHEANGELPEAQYVQALLRDLEHALPLIWGRPVHSIFIGGGTPSLFSAQAIDELLAGIRARVRLDADAEITMEANPGTVESERFRGYAEAGVNRISVGVQTFDDAALKALGRIHAFGDAVRAAELAARHVGNFNLDLMYALPGQTVDLALRDIEQALALEPTHLSAYQLTLEPNTLFHRYPPALPDEDAQIDIEEAVHARLAQAGYQRYETSAFALPGRQCRHNLNYWRFGDYVGIGAGAHGKISLPDKVLRQIRYKQPKAYLSAVEQGQPVQEEREVPLSDMPFEFMLNALRLTDGFELSSYAERTGDSMASILDALDAAQAKGLIERDHRWARPTDLGRRFLNDLQAMFLKSV